MTGLFDTLGYKIIAQLLETDTNLQKIEERREACMSGNLCQMIVSASR